MANKVLKAGLGYTLGNILVKGINFLTLPIFSRLMTTEEFGTYNIFVSFDFILFILSGFAMHSCVRSANLEFKGKIKEFVSSITLLYLANLLLFLGLALLFADLLRELLGFKQLVLVLVVINGFSMAIIHLYNEYISLDYSYKKYMLVAGANAILGTGISLALMLSYLQDDKALGRMLGSTGVCFGLTIFIIAFFFLQAKPQVDTSFMKFALVYSAPVVPHGLSQVILAHFDRIMINTMLGAGAAGIFSLAGNLHNVMTVIITSVATVWSTWFYNQMAQGEISVIQKRARAVLKLFVVLVVGAICLSPELIYILGGQNYAASRYVAVPVLCSSYIVAAYNVIVVAEYYSKRTEFIMLGTMLAAGINIITNYIFIPCYGLYAAAYNTLFAYICYLLFHYYIAQKVVNYYIVSIRYMLFCSAIVVLVSGWTLVFIDAWLLRWGTGLIITMVLGYGLFKEYMQRKIRL